MTRADRIAAYIAVSLVIVGMFWPFFIQPECADNPQPTAPATSIYPQGRPTE